MNFLSLALLVFLVGCGVQSPSGSVPPSFSGAENPVPGQETHGGDLAVAMLRAALMQASELSLDRNLVSRIMTLPAYSEISKEEGPIFSKEEQTNLLRLNRARLLNIADPNEVVAQLQNRVLSPFKTNPYSTRPHYLGETMTPKHFRERGEELFGRLEACLKRTSEISIDFLFPEFSEEKVKKVTVRYADSELRDVKTQKRVDVGVSLGDSPEILLDRERMKDWAIDNFATDYLVFHEYTHVLLREANRSDSDHVFAVKLFHDCSYSSSRFELGRKSLK